MEKLIKPSLNISNTTNINDLLLADDLAIIQDTEDDIQRSLHQLNNLWNTVNMRTS